VDTYTQGLRCQDVNAGVRNFDAASPVLTPVKKTRLVGMAADLAALVRGTEIISDMAALESVAAAELDIPSTSFDAVVGLLEESGLVEPTRSHGEITGLTSDVPHYTDLYAILGKAWRERRPSQLEEEVIAVVDQLARGPVAAESLVPVVGIERADLDRVLDLGTRAQLIKVVSGVDGTILYSPYTAFENPKLLAELAEKHGSGQLQAEFQALHERQGLAVNSEDYPLLYDAIGRGLVLAPAVELPGGGEQLFATMPYTLDRDLLIGEKPVLDKALAIIACVRCGEQFGGYSNLIDPVSAINALLRYGELGANSASRRQYRLMRNKGIVVYGPDPQPWGSWVIPKLVDTPDNRRALEIARDLLTLGESMSGRDAEAARGLLSADARYLTPMKTVSTIKPKLVHRESEYAKMIAAFMGYGTTA
jgi:hypothetical protein